MSAPSASSSGTSSTRHADTAVVGGGIVGLAHALAAAKQGEKVVLFERDEHAVGASIRNFGLLWPVGQPAGPLYERALRAREIWLDVVARTGLWCARSGSLHLARHADEQAVLEEFLQTRPDAVEQGCRLLTPREVAEYSAVARTDGLRCALWSPTELNVDPRQVVPRVAELLERDYGVVLRFGETVRDVTLPDVTTNTETWRVDRAFLCSGNDYQTLRPEVFSETAITHCKLQMMRTVRQPADFRLGPSLCGGLTLLHYEAFAHCETLTPLQARFDEELPFHREHGVHVLVSQTCDGELALGDSHAYAMTHDPFEYENVNAAILDYLATFAGGTVDYTIAERWHGVYPSLPGQADLVAEPEPGVTLVNGLGGAGMTLSFGLAEENV